MACLCSWCMFGCASEAAKRLCVLPVWVSMMALRQDTKAVMMLITKKLQHNFIRCILSFLFMLHWSLLQSLCTFTAFLLLLFGAVFYSHFGECLFLNPTYIIKMKNGGGEYRCVWRFMPSLKHNGVFTVLHLLHYYRILSCQFLFFLFLNPHPFIFSPSRSLAYCFEQRNIFSEAKERDLMHSGN